MSTKTIDFTKVSAKLSGELFFDNLHKNNEIKNVKLIKYLENVEEIFNNCQISFTKINKNSFL